MNNYLKTNWSNITNNIDCWDELCSTGLGSDYAESNPTEAIDVAKNHGDLYDLDNMVHLKSILGFSVSWNLYTYINGHLDGGILELTKEDDLPALNWLIEDYARNGDKIEKEDIWDHYDYASEQDEYGFVGWHNRVKKGLVKEKKRVYRISWKDKWEIKIFCTVDEEAYKAKLKVVDAKGYTYQTSVSYMDF